MVEEMDRKKILGIIGSPRRGGNTEVLVDQALVGAEEAGAQVTKFILNELEIAPCQGCDVCADTGTCVQQDHMPALLEHMKDNHVWVLGTPIYWWGPTAQFKAFLDRWHCVKPAEFAGRRVILIIPHKDPDESQARCTIEMLGHMLDHFNLEQFATIVVPDVREAGRVRKYPGFLEAAYRAGHEAVTRPFFQPQTGAEESEQPYVQDDVDEGTVYVDDPSQIREPHLVVTGAPIPLPQQEEVLIGRIRPEVTPSPDVDLVPHGGDQSGVSRQHARMLYHPDGWVIEDLKSTNGTFVNGVQVPPGQQVSVHTGDVIRLGMLTMIFYE